MKVTIDDLKETHTQCMHQGKIKEKHIDKELVKSLKTVAEQGLHFINNIVDTHPKRQHKLDIHIQRLL